MEYIITIGLTLIVFCSIIIVIDRKSKNFYGKKVYRQSDMHNMLKLFFTNDIYDNKKTSSQMIKRIEEASMKVVILQNKAYWVIDNVFYVGDAENGIVKPDTGVPLDTSNMSAKDIDKLLFILDNIKGGKANDSSSTGNE